MCFAYYNYRDTHLGDMSQIVSALIKQVCRRRTDIPASLLRIKNDALSPSLAGTQKQFLSLIESRSQVYIVFDALDECPERDRKYILSFITGIVTAPTSCRIKIFVTSRREMDISTAFEDKRTPTIQIEAGKVATDIATYARGQVEALRRGQNGQTLYVLSDDLAETIIQTLAAKADGM